MTTVAGRRDKGLYKNGQAEYGNNSFFTDYSYYTLDSLSGDGCFAVDYNVYGSGALGAEFIPVDTSKTYQHSVSVKTIETSYLGRNGSGHLGFACYDEDFQFIDLRNLKGIGDTTLTRAASAGDTNLYVADASAWHIGGSSPWRCINFFPPTHPTYSYSVGYTRLAIMNNAYAEASLVDLGGGEWRVPLNFPLPDYGYAMPAGTYVTNARAGGTYNYCHGAPVYPTTWTTYITEPFTGESRNSSLPFRYATKYIRFLNLRNYNYRAENAGDSARYLIDNIMLIELSDGKEVKQSFFSTSRSRR